MICPNSKLDRHLFLQTLQGNRGVGIACGKSRILRSD